MIKCFNWITRGSDRLSAAQERDILALVKLGREVEAVKQIRRWTNMTLPAAVNMVADYRAALNQAALPSLAGD